jgi:hypothetical protein
VPQDVASAGIESSYYPSSKIRLVVRFEELGSSSSVVDGAKKLVPQTVLRGTKAPRAPLVVSADPESPPGVNRLILLPAGGGSSSGGGPQDQQGSGDGLTFTVAGIIPKRASFDHNGIRAADTLTAHLRWMDCPIDPRVIRSCAVEWYIGTVSAEDYEAGARGKTRAASNGTTGGGNYAEPLCLVPDNWVDASGNQRTNLRFLGFVDVWTSEETGEEEGSITLECRDNTQLLIDVEAPSGLGVGVNDPIDKAIATYLANFPNFAGISIEFRPSTATPPKLVDVVSAAAYQKKLGAMVPTRSGGAVQKLSVWDYLTDLCGMLGFVVYVDGTTIIIQEPQTLYGAQGVGGTSRGRTDDPFVEGGGRSVDGEAFQRRRMIWGRNVKTKTVRRNFNKNAPTNVEVRAYSQRRKKQLVARFPDPKSQRDLLAVHALPGGAADQRWTVWRVRWVEDVATLARIARQIYQSGRNEFSVEVVTHNLASFGGDNLDPDVLDMRAGDPFDLLTAQDADQSSYTETEQQLIAQTTDYMTGLAYDPGFAAAYAKVYQATVGFQNTFRLKALGIDWDADAGDEPAVTLSIHGVNYVEVRLDQPLAGTGGT